MGKALVRTACCFLAILMLLPGFARGAAAGDFISLGFLPLSTHEERVVLRGTAPDGATVVADVNGVEAGRTETRPGLAVYSLQVALAPGENRIRVRLDGGGPTADAVLYRNTTVFTDMEHHWAQEDAEILATLGIVSGMAPGQFGPDLPVTRAQFAKLVDLSLGLKPEDGSALPFTDARQVPDWAKGLVMTAVDRGLIRGYEDHTFRPDRPVTRLELVVVARRGLALKGAASQPRPVIRLAPFLDQKAIPGWAQADIDAVQAAGLLGDFWGEEFLPARPATRAEAAAVLRRLVTAAAK